MPQEPPYPEAPNGSKGYLEANQDALGLPTVRAVCHAALYLGYVLECLCYEVWRQGTNRQAAPWFPPKSE